LLLPFCYGAMQPGCGWRRRYQGIGSRPPRRPGSRISALQVPRGFAAPSNSCLSPGRFAFVVVVFLFCFCAASFVTRRLHSRYCLPNAMPTTTSICRQLICQGCICTPSLGISIYVYDSSLPTHQCLPTVFSGLALGWALLPACLSIDTLPNQCKAHLLPSANGCPSVVPCTQPSRLPRDSPAPPEIANLTRLRPSDTAL
jgi:hypothetical protein